jgi:hypothetical protein
MVAKLFSDPMPSSQHQRIEGFVLCPKCGLPLPSPTILAERHIERYDLSVRSYFGWCFGCDAGFAVIQVKARSCWQVLKWQEYSCDGPNDAPRMGEKWNQEMELPVPAVLTGPGREYDEPICMLGTTL